MKPKIYGYMRVLPGKTAEDLSHVRRDLTDYAQRKGFRLAEVFTDSCWPQSTAYRGLIDSIKRSQAHDLLVPSLAHFSQPDDLGSLLKAAIEQETGARVWVVEGQGR